MHPDQQGSFDDDHDFLLSNTIPNDWLQNIQWNKENCLILKHTNQQDLNQLLQLRDDSTAFFCRNDREIRIQLRIFENKLVRNFSKLIVARRTFDRWDEFDELRNYSLLNDWFLAIGLDEKCKEILTNQYEDIEELLNADEEELKILLMRGFNLKIDRLDLDDYDQNNDADSSLSYSSNESNLQSRMGVNDGEDRIQDLRNYVRDYKKRVLKAQRSLHQCLNALKNSLELPSNIELCWDSWDHWINHADESKKASLASAIAAASKKSKHSPKPLPPLPDLKTNFLRNYRINGNGDSRSTGSSPLSPPVPPLSAGNFSHRSTSSSSSSIIQSGFHYLNNGLNIIFDPNHVSAPVPRRPTPPPTPPVSHSKKSFIFTSASIFASNSFGSRNSERKFPTTPPPIRRHQTHIMGSENFPLTKSKSHEEHLSHRIEPLDPVVSNKLLKKYNLIPGSTGKSNNSNNNKNNQYHHHHSNKHNSLDNLPHLPHQTRRRLATEPGSIGSTSPILISSNCSSPIAISPENQTCSERQSSSVNATSGSVGAAAVGSNVPGNVVGGVDNCFLDPVPRSPRSQAMSHSIHHRFVSTMKINSIQCNVCAKQMFFGFKCRDCKYYCHRDCQEKAPNSCGLPSELVDLFKQTLSEGQTRSSSPKNLPQRARSQMNYYPSSMNSRSSSNPSSPALFTGGTQSTNSSSSSATISPTANFANNNINNKNNGSQFQFPPDINITSTMSIDYDDCQLEQQNYLTQSPTAATATTATASAAATFISDEEAEMMMMLMMNSGQNPNKYSTITEEEETIGSTVSPTSTIVYPSSKSSSPNPSHPTASQSSSELVDSEKSTNSALVTSGSSGDSVRTVTGRLDSQDSQASDGDEKDRQWPRQNSVTSKEWDIPYDELKIEEEIGTGRFGTVFRGKWHGSVAIKRLNMANDNNPDEEEKTFETFKQEVAIFRKTRHDNLVLFMGACMKPPHLAIVTSLCKGLTLHTHIHVRHDKFNLNRTIMIAEQICLGMGYLHAREIIHKDLKTKNIFYENGRVIITDFGLSSVAKLCKSNRRGDWLTVPKGWLCYLAPEIIRTLGVDSHESECDLPFSFSTDVYAFGTVWFELLFGCWPFTNQPAEAIIWQVGKGIKQAIINFITSKEIKDLLYTCWAFLPEARPDFGKIYEYLEKLPKKRLQRSPSHPAHLQHASEQTFF